MKKKSRKPTPKKEEIAEDWCFVCKDGGELRVCDYKDCLKSYHPDCVGKDDSFLESERSWKCEWHTCYVSDCNRTSKFKCYMCPKSVCGRCIKIAEFVHVKGKKGFCDQCLKFALLVEEKIDVDSDGESLDFESRETFEGLFKEYWEIINETEGLTAEDLKSANTRYRMSKNYNSNSDGSESDERNEVVSDYDDSDNAEAHKPGMKSKRSKGQLSSGKGKVKVKVKASETKFIGWGSKSLLLFLRSIGRDTTKELSQREVTNIVTGYIKEKNLLDAQRKKIVVCDERLQLILARKTVNKHRIYDLLESHFAENQEESEEKEIDYSSEDMDDNVSVACKRQKKSTADRISQREEPVLDIRRFYFAAIVPENIKLVYLKKSLVEILSNESETFESKVIGSFVRIKLDPNECFRRNCFQLGQVTGIKKHPVGGNDQEILLRIANMSKDISISVLSDNDFSEEECLDLKNKVKSGLLKKLTVDGLEQKAKILHKDITEHWIPKERESLERRAEHANIKGWRREFFEYMERKQKLEDPTEKSRLLQQIPKVIVDDEELGPVHEDAEDDKEGEEESPKSILMDSSVIRSANLKINKISSDAAVINGKSSATNNVSGSVKNGEKNEEAIIENTAPTVAKDNNKAHIEKKSSLEGATIVSTTTPKEDKLHMKTSLKPSVIESPQNQKARSSSSAFIDLSCDDDDGDGKSSSAAIEKEKNLEDPKSSAWHCVGPNGERNGPLSLKLLKDWSKGTPFASKFKVWKENQTEEAAIPLMDAINLAFP